MSVIADTGSTAPTTLTPLRSDSGPPITTRAVAECRSGLLDLEAHLAVVDQQLNARRQRGEHFRMRQRHPLARARRRVEVEAERFALGEPYRAVREPPDPQLWTLQVGEDRDRPAGFLLDRAHDVVARLMLLVAAMAEVEAEHVGPGLEQGADHFRA